MFSHGTAGSGSAAFSPSRYAPFAVIPVAFAGVLQRRVTAPGAEALGRRLSLRPPCSKLLP
ncbi:MAG: hypothetical protein IKI72_08520, partial [Bacteroidales bacterium]|nr:hypothetical protein [Bacteroidales bacterium]